MRRHRELHFSALFVSGLIALFAGSPAPGGDKKKDNLDGTWTVKSWIVNGEPVPGETRRSAKLILKGDSFEFHLGNQVTTGTFKSDTTKKPKTFDVTAADGPNKGKTILGIYELNGETMRNCHGRSETIRPKNFSSNPGNGQVLIVYERDKQ